MERVGNKNNFNVSVVAVDREKTLKYDIPLLITKNKEIIASDSLKGRKEVYEIAGKEEILEIFFFPEEEIKRVRESLLDNSILAEEEEEEIEELPESDNELDKVLHLFIKQAIEKRSSDVHLSPNSRYSSLKFRINGELIEQKRFSKKANRRLINKLKSYAGLDITNSTVPQDGKFSLLIGGKIREFRLSTLPTKWGERAVVRVMYPEFILSTSLSDLGFEEEQRKDYEKAFLSSEGLIVNVGGTGEGKSTTLLVSILEIAKRFKGKNILTAEDPIEVDLSPYGISQSEVSPEQGRTYPVLLKSFLRQDPDVIMVGEIRDSETAKIAVESSLTGHLVLTTLHAPNVVGALFRLIEIGIPPIMLASTMKLIVSQRLIPLLCPSCKKKVKLPLELVERYSLPFDFTWERGKGCKKCSYSGIIGRKAIFEVLPFEKIKSVFLEEVSETKIKKKLKEEGFRSMWKVGIDRVKRGEISLFDLLIKVQPDPVLDLGRRTTGGLAINKLKGGEE